MGTFRLRDSAFYIFEIIWHFLRRAVCWLYLTQHTPGSLLDPAKSLLVTLCCQRFLSFSVFSSAPLETHHRVLVFTDFSLLLFIFHRLLLIISLQITFLFASLPSSLFQRHLVPLKCYFWPYPQSLECSDFVFVFHLLWSVGYIDHFSFQILEGFLSINWGRAHTFSTTCNLLKFIKFALWPMQCPNH